MAGYTRQQQVEDLAIIEHTKAILSARVAGERQSESEAMLKDYVRISRYFAPNDKGLGNIVLQHSVKDMFLEFVQQKKVSAFHVAEYENLLRIVKAKVRSMLVRRRKKEHTCNFPAAHVQPCYCGNARRGREMAAFGQQLPELGKVGVDAVLKKAVA